MQSFRPNHGGEIAGHCHDAISRQDLVHGHATPRTPGMNARYECFHGTIQDAFLFATKPCTRLTAIRHSLD